MDQSFELKGYWYLPGEGKERRIPGILKFEPTHGIKLELIGGFPPNMIKLKLIWGYVSGDKAITLYNSFEVSRNNIFMEVETAVYAVNMVFMGGWFTDENDLSFNKVAARFSYMDNWFNFSQGFKIKYGKGKFKTSVEYELPEAVILPITRTMQLSIKPAAAGPSLHRVQKEVTISQKLFFVLESKRKVRLREMLKLLTHFQNFLSVVTQQPVYPRELSMYFKTKDSKKLYEAKVFYQLKHFPYPINENLDPRDCFIDYELIKDIFPSLVKKWYLKGNLFHTSLVPYVVTFNNHDSYASDRFIELAKSIEAFHRETTQTKVEFKKRVVSVFKKYKKAYSSVLKIRSINELAEKIKNFRNDFTHSNPISSMENKKYLETHFLSEKIAIVMACAFLNEIGVPLPTSKNSIELSTLSTLLKFETH